jgi:hypothetical protein
MVVIECWILDLRVLEGGDDGVEEDGKAVCEEEPEEYEEDGEG